MHIVDQKRNSSSSSRQAVFRHNFNGKKSLAANKTISRKHTPVKLAKRQKKVNKFDSEIWRDESKES